MSEIEHIRKCSQYLDILMRTSTYSIDWLISENNIRRRYPLTGLYKELQLQSAQATSFNDLLGVFRRFKQLQFLRIGSRDLLRYADLAETTSQLSDLASVSMQVGLEKLTAHPEWWVRGNELKVWQSLEGNIPLVVLGLGKLGGQELNYVSDIDLIFLYIDGDQEESEGFIMLLSRLAHWLSRLLSDRFEGDRIFQVDFRLRPQGKDGLLVPSLSAAVEHYLLRGRAWERQMLLKCRPVAGNRSAGSAFIHEVRPFVFRRFLDFQALDELKEMRNKILMEALRYSPGGGHFDVKLGIGGIREIEFLVQSMQLIYGGRRPELDEPNTLKCLEKLSTMGLFPPETACELKDSYTFLRNVEHYIQLDQNRQTQRLPQAEESKLRLTRAMGFDDDLSAFMKALEAHCLSVHSHFTTLFQESRNGAGSEEAHSEGDRTELESFSSERAKSLRETFKSYTPAVTGEILRTLDAFSECGQELQEKVLLRVDTYFGRVARRPGLRKLFDSSPRWLTPLCRSIASSELFSGLVTHNPALVEGLAVRQDNFAPFAEWESKSLQLLERAGDYGEKLEWIRRLKNERVLQLILADLAGEIDFAALEVEHTILAEFVIKNTLEAVRQNLGLPAALPLSVLGMGKLGSCEMSYLSDLDLVFVYSPGPAEPENQIPGSVVRLIQRLMNMLNTPLQEGPGYPVDARLRPSGGYGPLVVTKSSWLEYYRGQADIWEIQALLRVRHIAGDSELGGCLEGLAEEICYRRRAAESVWPRICHLRERMENERAVETEAEIDLKLGMGGLADIEFIVQGLLLLHGYEAEQMHIRSVRSAVESLLLRFPETMSHSPDIISSFRCLRAIDHRMRLYGATTSGKLNESHFMAMSSLGLWPPPIDGGGVETWQDVLRLRREVRAIFREFCS